MNRKIKISGLDNLSSEGSSYCSTHASNKVVDRYIDGEQHQERSSRQIYLNSRTHVSQPNGGIKRPPQFHHATPGSPTNAHLTQKPRSHSFHDHNKESKHYMSTCDWVKNSAAHESQRKLAKQVIERLL